MKNIQYLFLVILFLGCSSLDNFSDSYERLVSRYEKKIEQKPEDKKLRLELAKFYYRFNEHEKVIKLLRNETHSAEKLLLAKTYVRAEKYREGLAIFEQNGLDFSDDDESIYLYGYALEKNKMFDAAVKQYQLVSSDKWKAYAKKRKAAIGIKTEENVPDYIVDLEKKHLAFTESANEGAIFLLVDEKIEVTKKNTVKSDAHIVKKIIDDRGRALAEIQIGYDSTYQDVRLEFARVITPENEVIYAGEENIRDVSKYLNFPLYSNARVRIISMPAVQVGSIIEYKYSKVTSKIPNKDSFSFIYSLQERYPIAQSKFTFITPNNKKVNLNKINLEYSDGLSVEPRITIGKNQTTRVWEFDEVKAIVPEAKMPPYSEITGGLVLSGVSDWQEIYRWWKNLYKDKLALSADTLGFLTKLLKGAKNEEEKAKRIHQFCAREIRYVAVEYGASGYEPHTAETVFRNRYGDCKDQAILLVALMRAAGVTAYPVLIPTKAVYNMDKAFPVILFNHAIAVIRLNEEWIYLDSTSSTSGFRELPIGDQNRNVLVFSEKEGLLKTTPQKENNEIWYETNIKIHDDESADIIRKVVAKGFFADYQRYYFQYTHPKKILEDITKKIVEISSFSKLVDYKNNKENGINYIPEIEYKFKVEKLLRPAGSLRIFDGVKNIAIDSGYIGKRKRSYPIDFQLKHLRTGMTKLELPLSLDVKFLPTDTLIDNKWFTFSANYSIKGKSVIIKRVLKINETRVAVSEYADFKRELKRVLFRLKEAVIMERKN